MLDGGPAAPPPTPPRLRVQFRPGTLGVAFAPAIPAAFEGMTGFGCTALAGLGLAMDTESGSIGGVPNASGEHEVIIHAVRAAEPIEIDATIIINADPRSLWRAIEPPADAPHPKPHTATLHLTGDFTIVGASKRGRSHAHGGGFREDHIGARVVGPWHLLAVADGAGSAALSRLGSRIAVETALDALAASLNPSPSGEGLQEVSAVLVSAARAAVDALDARAAADAIDRRALSTTLILTVVRRVEAGIFTAAIGIGDGGAGIVDLTTGTLATLTLPDGGEFAGQTRFLDTVSCAEARVLTDIRPGFSALLLMTDGITDPHLPTEAAFANVDRWAALWREISGAVDVRSVAATDQLLAWLDFWSHGNHDDRTLLVLLP